MSAVEGTDCFAREHLVKRAAVQDAANDENQQTPTKRKRGKEDGSVEEAAVGPVATPLTGTPAAKEGPRPFASPVKAATATRRRPQLASLELLGDGHHFETVQVRIDSRQDMKTSEKEGLPPCPYLQFAVTDRYGYSMRACAFREKAKALDGVLVVHRSYCITGFGLKKKGRPELDSHTHTPREMMIGDSCVVSPVEEPREQELMSKLIGSEPVSVRLSGVTPRGLLGSGGGGGDFACEFTPLHELKPSERDWYDCIGVVVDVSDAAEVTLNATSEQTLNRRIVLADESMLETPVTLWGFAAREQGAEIQKDFLKTLGPDGLPTANDPLVVAFKAARCKEFNGRVEVEWTPNTDIEVESERPEADGLRAWWAAEGHARYAASKE